MIRIVCITILCLAFLSFFQAVLARGQKELPQKGWTGRLQDGKTLTKEDLNNILLNHQIWLDTNQRYGNKADLRGADLRKADLIQANLRGAYLSGVNLCDADMYEADLHGADLSKAKLIDADMEDAQLSEADLREADFYDANLRAADLSGADLEEAELTEVDLREANLSNADLTATYLDYANLRKANLSNADLSNANLEDADLYEADLSGAHLINAYLTGAYLHDANLNEADLTDTDLNGAIFQIKLECIPKIKEIDYAINLSQLTYIDRPSSLVVLRDVFKNRGMRKQEREITRAIKRAQMLKFWKGNSTFKKIEACFNYIFFDLTCQYGMKPGRSLIILFLIIPIFSFIYLFALRTKRQKTGIWLIFIKERVVKSTKKDRPFKITANFPPRVNPTGKLNKIKLRILQSYRTIRIALYFSLLSATNIGWRELNVGNWISRLQRREYTLKATGWVRTVAGLQSLISVYLLALWALTYFGRPFEAV